MKYFPLILFYFLIVTQLIFPQWTNQNPVPDGNHLNSVFFIDDYEGWMVGSGGYIMKTTNSGLDWMEQNSGTSLTLNSVQFINPNVGWICGGDGLIIKTTNGGYTWSQLPSNITYSLNDLHFCDLYVGYAVGNYGTILKTTNSGLDWIIQQVDSSYSLLGVDFYDQYWGYAVGSYEKVLHTNNGGSNWIVKPPVTALNRTLNCVEFIDPYVGFVGYEDNHRWNEISKTTDGGESWFLSMAIEIPDTVENEHDSELPLTGSGGIQSIYFKDSNFGYAVGGRYDGWSRAIYVTTNGGTSWQSKYGYTEQTGLRSVFVCNNGKGWAVGYHGTIYTTEDGISWSQILSGKPVGYNGDWIYTIYMLDEDVGWAAGNRKGIQKYPIILKTTNGGKIWKTVYERNTTVTDPYSEIYFINDSIGWVSGIYWGTLKTTNGGYNWIFTGPPSNELFFVNQDTGWKAYQGIYKTTDGGNNWVSKSTINSYSIFFSNINNGWAVGPGGSILKSTDEGETWITKTSGTFEDLSLVRFYDNNVGMCVGSSGLILLSTDGGESWISKSGPNLYDLTFTNPTTIWGATAGGEVYQTTNFGDNWSTLNTGIGGVTSFFIDENMGWVGNNNNIFKYFVEPVSSPLWSNEMIIADAGGIESSTILTFGQHLDATDSIDTSLGEYELPPPPVSGTFDARFNLSNNPVVSSLTDYRNTYKNEIIWDMTFQPGSSGYPITFTWDSTSFPEGTFYLKDQLNQSFVFVDMKEQSNYILTEPAITSLNISYKGLGKTVSVNNEWNMISVPLLAEDMSVNNLYPTATSAAYGYDSGYVAEDTLEGGVGYWLKFGANEEVQIYGLTFEDTISVEEGWNLLSAYEQDIPVTMLTTTPPEIISTFFFGFDDGYYISDTLKAGKGYWVRVNDNGRINLFGGSSEKPTENFLANINENWGKIKIADNFGSDVTLYATEEEIESNFYELPPMPPTGILDVRYTSGRMVENLIVEKIIQISSDKYPITIRAEGINISVKDRINGQMLNESVKNGEEIRITNNKITRIAVRGRITGGLPVSYELYQNYPNPFNPATTIKFAVPKASKVNLSVYNVLGELVSTVVDEQIKPGYYEYKFNGINFSSGVYIYKIRADGYNASKKMILLK